VEEEEEPRTPLQSTSKEGEDEKTWIKIVVGQITISLLNCNIKKNEGHHCMSIIACTNPTKKRHKNYKYPTFRKNFECLANNTCHY